MYFTQTAIRNNQLVVASEYISTRLVRKGDLTSYYVVRCLANLGNPTAKDSICFLKQTVVREALIDPLVPNPAETNVDKYRRVYNNQVRVHQYVSKSVNFPGKHYSELMDYWHDMEGVYHRFTVVTKYEEFGDLKHFIDFVRQEKIQLTDTEVIYILNNILKATLELYKIGVIHRDIKPENIFIDEFFQVKLGDFGIALADEKGMNPSSNEKVGTIGYMAPEIFYQQSYSFPVDVWAIGTVLYNLIYLAYPFGADKQEYAIKANGFLKEIKDVSNYSDKFSKRLKDFVHRFFVKNPEKREKAIYIYDFEYIHEFRVMEITLSLKKKYEEHIKRVNSCNTMEIERYCLQQHSLYHEKVLEVVRYEQWGYFLFLSNLKVVALFNSESQDKLIKIFPDCLDETPNFSEDVYCNILSHVFKAHFKKLRDHFEIEKRVYSKRLNTTIANIVQYNDTLAIRLRPELSGESKRELRKKEGDLHFPSVEQYQQFMPVGSNKDPISFDNNTFQLFFFPEEKPCKVQKRANRDERETELKYTTYKASLIFNNSMIKKDEVIVSEIDHKRKKIDNIYHMTKYTYPEQILYSEKTGHRNMLHHARKLFSFVATTATEQSNSPEFLQNYTVFDN